MEVWQAAIWIAACGAVGGIGAAVLSDVKGLELPRRDGNIIRPGFFGLVFVGALAAVVSWGLYGPLANATFVGSDLTGQSGGHEYGLTLAALVGAIGVGVGGAKWLANYVDTKVLKEATAKAAERGANQGIAAKIRTSKSARSVLELTRDL